MSHTLWRLIAVLSIFVAAAANAAAKPVYYIYLAGPEVFLPEPAKAGAAKKDLIERLNE